VIFLVGVALALFVVPYPWNIGILVLFGFLEIGETIFTWRYSRRAKVQVGPETLIGATGRAVTDCRPDGTVRVHAEMWQATCEAGVGGGQRIRVTARDGLLLTVEPIQ
jgi:membrane-bound serine protease (ClpP class)